MPIYMELGDSVLPSLLAIFNAALSLTHFRNQWKLAKVKIIRKPKKDNYDTLSSFRPVSVVNSLAKVFEKALLARLTWLSLTGSWISSNQHGFVGGRSTETAAHALVSFVEKGFSARRCAAAIFIDIKSAFDSAWRPAFLAALIDRHCPLYLVRIVDSFLSDRHCVFDFDHLTLSTYEVHTGCPQGSVISPFLWAVLIDDALRFTVHPHQLTVAFADDMTVVSASLSPVEAMRDLQGLCDRLVVWLGARKHEVCPAKSTVLIFFRRPSILERCGDLSLSFCGAAVPKAASTRFLGYTIDQKLNWRLHIVARCIAAKRLLFACKRYLGLS